MTSEISYGAVLARTEDAVLFNMDGADIWIPKSVIDDERLCSEWDGEAYGDDAEEGPGEVTVALWFLQREGLA